MPAKARYVVESDLPGLPLRIRDVGPWDKHPTVTNDAENVVAELVDSGRLPNGRRLYYVDSNGDVDELLIAGGVFAGFAPGGGLCS